MRMHQSLTIGSFLTECSHLHSLLPLPAIYYQSIDLDMPACVYEYVRACARVRVRVCLCVCGEWQHALARQVLEGLRGNANGPSGFWGHVAVSLEDAKHFCKNARTLRVCRFRPAADADAVLPWSGASSATNGTLPSPAGGDASASGGGLGGGLGGAGGPHPLQPMLGSEDVPLAENAFCFLLFHCGDRFALTYGHTPGAFDESVGEDVVRLKGLASACMQVSTLSFLSISLSILCIRSHACITHAIPFLHSPSLSFTLLPFLPCVGGWALSLARERSGGRLRE